MLLLCRKNDNYFVSQVYQNNDNTLYVDDDAIGKIDLLDELDQVWEIDINSRSVSVITINSIKSSFSLIDKTGAKINERDLIVMVRDSINATIIYRVKKIGCGCVVCTDDICVEHFISMDEISEWWQVIS